MKIMDLTQIEKMILEILSEEEKLNDLSWLKDLKFEPQDKEPLEAFVQKMQPFVEPAIKMSQLLAAVQKLKLSKMPIEDLQANWKTFIKDDTPPNEEALKEKYAELKAKLDDWEGKAANLDQEIEQLEKKLEGSKSARAAAKASILPKLTFTDKSEPSAETSGPEEISEANEVGHDKKRKATFNKVLKAMAGKPGFDKIQPAAMAAYAYLSGQKPDPALSGWAKMSHKAKVAAAKEGGTFPNPKAFEASEVMRKHANNRRTNPLKYTAFKNLPPETQQKLTKDAKNQNQINKIKQAHNKKAAPQLATLKQAILVWDQYGKEYKAALKSKIKPEQIKKQKAIVAKFTEMYNAYRQKQKDNLPPEAKELVDQLQQLKDKRKENYQGKSLALARTDYKKPMEKIADQIKNMPETVKLYQRIKKLSDANELIKSKGPFKAYQDLIITMDRSGAASGMLTEEEPADTSDSFKRLKKHFERYAPALVGRLEDLRRKETDKEGHLPDYLFKWIKEIKEMLDPALKAAIEGFEKIAGEPPKPPPDETDTDGDGIPDREEVEAGTDPKDPKDPTTDSPEDIGPAEPKTLDVAAPAEEGLKKAFANFRDKFYCDIPEGANRREETEALEKCRARGVAVTQNEQHAYIRALIDALEPIVNTEEREAFRCRWRPISW